MQSGTKCFLAYQSLSLAAAFLFYCSAITIQPSSEYIRYENYRVLKQGMIPCEKICVVLFIEVGVKNSLCLIKWISIFK